MWKVSFSALWPGSVFSRLRPWAAWLQPGYGLAGKGSGIGKMTNPCERKFKYKTYKAALKAKILSQRGDVASLWPYRCDKCGYYHLGNDNGYVGIRHSYWKKVEEMHKDFEQND